jgi:hypothetical protein
MSERDSAGLQALLLSTIAVIAGFLAHGAASDGAYIGFGMLAALMGFLATCYALYGWVRS